MSKIDKLIEELCPDGVEYTEIGNQCIIKTGDSINKSYISKNPGKYPVVNSGQDPLGYINKFNVENDEIGIASRGAGVGFVSWTEGKYFRGNLNYSVTIEEQALLDKRFLYHYLKDNTHKIDELATFHGIPALNASNLKKLLIPLPPLPVQEEIVSILDSFTQLTAELTAELTARKRQYEHYRDELLTFGDEVEWKALGEVGKFKYGYTDKAMDKGDVRFIRITDIDDGGKLKEENSMYINLSKESEEFLVRDGDLLMARTGATYGKTMLFKSKTPSVYASFLIRIRFKEEQVLPEYYWHFAQSHYYWTQANTYVSKAGQPQFNANALKRVKIPIPPLAEQERIVSILDKFDALTNDIAIGLPAEIEARQKQYEYYREKLLTFKELETKEA